MAAGHLDFPEHFAVGLKPHRVKDRYYYARGPQLVNRAVDISTTIDQKIAAICANRTMVGNMVRELQSELAERNLKPTRYEWNADGKAILEKIQRARAALARQPPVT